MRGVEQTVRAGSLMFGHEMPILDKRSAMEDESFGVREAFKREPELTGYLIKLVLGGALVVSAFSVLAAVLVQALLVFPIVLVLSLIYSVVVLLTTARVVFAGASRRYMETALSSRTPRQGTERVKASEPDPREPERQRMPQSREPERPRSPDRARAPEPPAPVVEQDPFSEAYFMLRLQEEVASARRDGREMSVIAIDATVPGAAMSRETAERIAGDMAKIAADHHKTISHTLCLSKSEYVMSLPHTTAKEAKGFLSNMVQALGNYWCHFGVAVYPDDATSAEGMVNHAREAVEESRLGKGKSKSHAVA